MHNSNNCNNCKNVICMYMYAGFYNKVATKANGNEAFNNVRTLKFVVYSISMERNESK